MQFEIKGPISVLQAFVASPCHGWVWAVNLWDVSKRPGAAHVCGCSSQCSIHVSDALSVGLDCHTLISLFSFISRFPSPHGLL